MDNHFKVIVNKSKNYNISFKKAQSLDVIKKEKSKFHILQNNRSFKAELINSNFEIKQYTIVVNSNTYLIKIEDSLDQIIKEMGYSIGFSKKLNLIKAPMPGIIIGLHVKEGDKINEGDTLLILEAMKMENAITSPKNAIVKTVFVKTGETVEKNKLLIELE
jgi:biotin carboxyl carrier protein